MQLKNGFDKQQGLAKQALKGIAWLLGSRLWSQLLSLTVGIIMARLLQPSDYGLFGMATVFTNFMTLLSDFGMSSAIIQKQNLRNEQLSSVFWVNIAIGILLMGLTIVLSSLITRFFSQPILVPLTSVLSVNFLFLGLSVVPNAMFTKTLMFNVLAKISAFSVLVGGCVGIIAAFLGWGVWALAIQSLVASFLSMVGVWAICDWRPKLHFDNKDLRQIWGFSLNLLGFQSVNYLARNADYFLIGRFLGAGQLGYYTLAYNLMLYPVNNLVSVLSKGLFPAFSKIQGDYDRLANAYIKSCRYLGFATIPAMVGLGLLANETILTVFGAKWAASTPVLVLLSVVALFQPFASLSGVVVISRGLVNWFFKWSLVVTPIIIIGFLVGLNWGIVGVAACYMFTQIIIGIVGMPIQFKKIDVSMGKLLRALVTPTVASIVMGLVVFFARWLLLNSFIVSVSMRLIICAILGFIVYLGILFLMRNHYYDEFKLDFVQILNRTR